MRGALVILIAMVVIGVILFITDVIFYRRKGSEEARIKSSDQPSEDETVVESGLEEIQNHGEFCCGRHLVCEKTGLSPISEEIIYYDDEELDRYRGRAADSYTLKEEEEFRDVLLTLLPEDVPGWTRSITLRQINLPTNIREELLMIVNDLRGMV